MLRLAKHFLAITLLTALTACGYAFQGTRNPMKDLGIEKIYVQSFGYSGYRPGIEQYFTTAMVREIRKSNAFRLVNSESDADAVLTGSVTSVNGIGTTKSIEVTGEAIGGDNKKSVQVASTYNGSVNCTISLVERRSGRMVFTQSIGDSKVFPGSVLAGPAGATVPLTNDSEERIAYQHLASQMMGSVYQRMVNLF